MFVFVLDGFVVFLDRPGWAQAGFPGRFRRVACQPRPGRAEADQAGPRPVFEAGFVRMQASLPQASSRPASHAGFYALTV